MSEREKIQYKSRTITYKKKKYFARLQKRRNNGEGLDINAAFVSKAVKKVKNIKNIPDDQKVKKEAKDIDFLINKAQEYENSQCFKEAVQYLSEAITLKPESIELILKRSFYYFQLAKFEKSVRDAKKVIQYSPNNPHAYYRLGEGCFSLLNLTEAESAFTRLLNDELYREKAQNRLFSIHIKQLEEMGYNRNEAFSALTKSKNKTLDEAITFLNELEEGKHTEELYYSDEDESEEDEDCEEDESNESASGQSSYSSGNKHHTPIEISNKSPILTDPKNPIGCSSLFVGNLKKDITYQEVHNVFIKFGDIKSIKLTTKPSCFAFVNYEEASAAGQAMEALQSSRWFLSTMPLIVKYPIKVVRMMIPTLENPELILKHWGTQAPTSVRPSASVKKIPVVEKPSPGKPRPPPKTEECFYWRTMGCSYGGKCFNLHIPEHKGIDLKPPNTKKKLTFK
ncbi:uncharacterized protein LOC128984907 isoform X2 [Macrosteles quadrilineatus]|uniref:uncharacterized protein LOC128984907 isoform X2 n=1 Tax=Macrosteles quadrilineatus TaxID=74068 RepID=UPI0023E18E0D|nr:uncharacterized protein LOC128984907 isoform X2 [Macrosteles quadrilineatus]